MKKTIYYMILGCFLLCVGCSDWLSVNPKDKVEQEEMFSTTDGFKNALIGNYILLKDSKLYGRALTMDFVENLAQHWKTTSESVAGYTNAYDYANADVERLIEDIYGKFYNTIVTINNLLAFVDNGVLEPEMYDLIKGEALAMRAFCHLDVLRLFGPIPGEQNDNKILSYVRSVSKDLHPVHTWKEYTEYLEKDLNDAETLLKKIDEKGMDDDFFAYRQNRFNYWAVLGLKARFYLWIQNKEKAAEYANLVMESKKFRLNQGEDFAAKDNVASPEHLLSLHIYNLSDVVSAYFLQGSGVEQEQSKVKSDVYQSDITDYRVRYWWEEITEKSKTRYTLVKYRQEEMPAQCLQEVPLIRLYEMYLIAIECSDEESVYKPLVDELAVARNISVVNVADVDLKNAFVAKEYRKEFYGEG
ncbi:MAG: RagB/SusD family nutrient uptake outer membrane protein, partial [Odoribacter sp.]|nr:RagB/SusD family nutrient uptake outer membrane protein [Odoribacter sp.]